MPIHYIYDFNRNCGGLLCPGCFTAFSISIICAIRDFVIAETEEDRGTAGMTDRKVRIGGHGRDWDDGSEGWVDFMQG